MKRYSYAFQERLTITELHEKDAYALSGESKVGLVLVQHSFIDGPMLRWLSGPTLTEDGVELFFFGVRTNPQPKQLKED